MIEDHRHGLVDPLSAKWTTFTTIGSLLKSIKNKEKESSKQKNFNLKITYENFRIFAQFFSFKKCLQILYYFSQLLASAVYCILELISNCNQAVIWVQRAGSNSCFILWLCTLIGKNSPKLCENQAYFLRQWHLAQLFP